MSAINIEKISIAHWYPDLEVHKCGYCKNSNGSVSYGMWAEQLTVEDYQNLIDRGWRRSGMYCYKPMMNQTCCPQYTIRCNALDFQLSKSQKKIIKKFNKFLIDGSHNKEMSQNASQSDYEDNAAQEQVIIKERPSAAVDLISKLGGNSSSSEDYVNTASIFHKEINLDFNQASTSSSSPDSSVIIKNSENDMKSKDPGITENKTLSNVKKGVGADPNKPLCKKAKVLRIERKQQKLLEKGMTVEKASFSNEPKTLEQFLNEIPENSKHKLKLRLVSTAKFDGEMENVKNIEFQLYKKYQITIHNDPPEKCTMLGFTRFLISSPLKCIRVRTESAVVTFGTFHQQYWLDDKLIAVAVLDILPRCVSSVYFFYDPDYRFLTLGTYGSIREIEFVRKLNKIIPAIQHYYMGFYIHSCPKMRYKGKLSQSFLLCPETYHWSPIEKCIIKLEANKYSRLNDDKEATDEDLCTDSDIDRIRVCVSYSFTLFGNYKRKYGEQDVFDNIGKLIGKKCAASILFVSSKG